VVRAAAVAASAAAALAAVVASVAVVDLVAAAVSAANTPVFGFFSHSAGRPESVPRYGISGTDEVVDLTMIFSANLGIMLYRRKFAVFLG
jgi:hypothetical protein